MNNELATVEVTGLALEPGQTEWSPNQRAALTQIGVDKASDADLSVFMHVCQRTGLDPFARQIYMIERKGKQTIQTGIDGYRLVARRAVDRSREPLSIASAQWCGPDGQWVDVWLQDGPPAAAKVVVKRGSGEFTAVALWREYVQTTTYNGQTSVTKMWRDRPAGQLAKCAEALALRKAFPQDLSGVYVDAELDRADSVPGEVVVEQTAQRGLGAALAAQNSDPDPGDPPPPDDAAHEPMVSDAQLRNIGRLMGAKSGLGITDRAEALGYVSSKVGRPVESRNELTRDEASRLIDALERDIELAGGAS